MTVTYAGMCLQRRKSSLRSVLFYPRGGLRRLTCMCRMTFWRVENLRPFGPSAPSPSFASQVSHPAQRHSYSVLPLPTWISDRCSVKASTESNVSVHPCHRQACVCDVRIASSAAFLGGARSGLHFLCAPEHACFSVDGRRETGAEEVEEACA
jgi:hypothetical protein